MLEGGYRDERDQPAQPGSALGVTWQESQDAASPGPGESHR